METLRYAIGDVHGCGDELETLAYKCHAHATARGAKPILYQLGDLIDRGPDLVKTFEVAKFWDMVTLVGNHEAMFIGELLGSKPCNSKARRKTIEEFEQLSTQRQGMILDMITKESRNFILYTNGDTLYYLAHSLPKSPGLGSEPNATAVAFSTRKELIEESERPLIVEWVKAHYGVERVVIVHGHMHWAYDPIARQIEAQGDFDDGLTTLNIDSGCVYGESLTALCLDTLDVLQVESTFNFEGEH